MSSLSRQLSALGSRIFTSAPFGPGVSMQNLAEWSSLAHVQLLGKVAAEFGVDIDIEEAYRLDSFERLLQYIERRREPGGDTPPASSTPDAASDAAVGQPDTIGALLRARADALPDEPFLFFPADDLSYTYRAFHGLACAAADTLRAHGLARGDRLSVVLPNGPEFLAYYFGAHLLGVVSVPINPALTAAECAYIVRNSGAKLVVFDRRMTNLRDAVRAELGDDGGARLASADAASGFGLEALAALAATGERAALAPDPDLAAGDDASILYTSGTTGHPKGVVLSHRNLLSDARALVRWFAFEPGTRTMCILPLFHNNGQVITLLSPLIAGGSSVILEGKSALPSFWKLIDTYRVNWTSVMPAFLSAFLEYGLKRTDDTLRGIVCGGQVLLDEVRNRFESEYRVPVFEGFGLTETTSFATMNRHPAERRRFGSIGVALPCNALRIVDADGREVAAGETGEILIRGENVATRYHGLAELTAERFRDGWLHTGDYGYRDDEGHFFFATRVDDLIIKGGENIYPAEIENALHGCDDVVECAALGVPDPILGQDVCVYVKLRPSSTLGKDGVRRLCEGRIAHYKCPRHVVLLNELDDLPELPKGPTRKILRRKLLAHFATLRERESA
ncbi:AMP-binding protein [Burkholderia thailandensis]|uniref:AMP-binding enzyme family protein n=1 Tax=Burkholderia thailandensis TaxID=57975 RepID=A0AAW9CRT0_BURTH|nr:AMP-binding protein [Burkholderia thailandensis]AHI66875.1 AMP-binding enzyme family protein [Burkholderia thailandensis H0587]AJY31931.1 AMP-binding enzyme family protein [Burkholderia thailandensis 34]AOJ54565.1 fatty acid--CoA ligase [Burkholderia thailandensis]AOJ60525.1 fatty acid--CoA ligase [Burkholderia thailandensis]AVR27268.1 fatty acid--CoA ligase [Burkholderia thailandensis]